MILILQNLSCIFLFLYLKIVIKEINIVSNVRNKIPYGKLALDNGAISTVSYPNAEIIYEPSFMVKTAKGIYSIKHINAVDNNK